jgi:hypothetical protein
MLYCVCHGIAPGNSTSGNDVPTRLQQDVIKMAMYRIACSMMKAAGAETEILVTRAALLPSWRRRGRSQALGLCSDLSINT